MMVIGRESVLRAARRECDHPTLSAFCDLALDLKIWLLSGTPSILQSDDAIANRSFLIDGFGLIRARYDKIHMFDVDLDGGESYWESGTYKPGDTATVVKTPWEILGMTVCYDLRFPNLYRDLAQAGAIMLSVPSAFTGPTGQAHWQVLLRARAVENCAYIFAPAQCGEHPHGRLTHGHSLIVNPWGDVLAECDEKPGYILATIDTAKVYEARRSLPSLMHDRNYVIPSHLT